MGEEDKGVGRRRGNDKCMLRRTGKKYKCMSKHMKTDGAQFCSTRTRAKIAKKTQTIIQEGHQTLGILHHHCRTARNNDRTTKFDATHSESTLQQNAPKNRNFWSRIKTHKTTQKATKTQHNHNAITNGKGGAKNDEAAIKQQQKMSDLNSIDSRKHTEQIYNTKRDNKASKKSTKYHWKRNKSATESTHGMFAPTQKNNDQIIPNSTPKQ